jgi:hypothetical protein
MNKLDEGFELQPESAAIVTALLDSALDDSTSAWRDEEALARFACGWITPEESDAVIASLCSSSYQRSRLLQMRKSLNEAAVSPEARQAVFATDAPLKRTMLAALKTSAKVLSRWNEACEGARKKTGVSVEEKRSLRAIMTGIGMRLQESAMQPAFAATRSSAQAARVVVEPGNVVAELAVRAEEDQSLTAHAKFSKPFTEPQEISLYVVEPGGAWAWIGSNLARGSHWTLETPSFASMLGLEPGDVASNCFALSEGRWFMPRGWVPLRISNDLEMRGIASPTRLRLRKSPAIRDGILAMSFEFPDTLRQLFLEDQLTLSIAIGSVTFVLGAWAVKDLPPSLEIEIKAPSLGLPDCEFEMHSAICLMVRPS